MNLVISQELAQKILNFLGTQAYVQVYQLIDGMKALQPEAPPPPEQDAPKIERVK